MENYKWKEREAIEERPFRTGRVVAGVIFGLLAWYIATNVSWKGQPLTHEPYPTPLVATATAPAVVPTPLPVLIVVTATPDPLALELANGLKRLDETEISLATVEAKVEIVSTEVYKMVDLNDENITQLVRHDQTINNHEKYFSWLMVLFYVIGLVVMALAAGTLASMWHNTPTPTPVPYTIGQLGPEPTPLPMDLPEVAPERFQRTVLRTVQNTTPAPLLIRPVQGTFEATGPITERERVRIITSYARYKSFTQVCNVVYGYKNGTVLNRVKTVLQGRGE